MKIPHRILEKFEESARGVEYGRVTLELHFKQGIPRIAINKEVSFHLTQAEQEELFKGNIFHK